jgi:hypothetical protein
MAIAIGVGAIAGEVGKHGGAALELWVGSVDTCVDNVRAGTGTGTAVIGV